MAKRPGLQEGTPSASRHEQGSYLPIRCRQKGFLPFSNWTPAAPWVGHTKLPRCQRRFFSSGFLLLPLGFLFFFFFTPGTKGQRWVPWGQRVEVATRAASGRAPRTRCGVSGRFRLQILLHPQCQGEQRGGRKLCQPQHRAALCEGRVSGSTFIKKKSALCWVGTRGGQGRGRGGGRERSLALSAAGSSPQHRGRGWQPGCGRSSPPSPPVPEHGGAGGRGGVCGRTDGQEDGRTDRQRAGAGLLRSSASFRLPLRRPAGRGSARAGRKRPRLQPQRQPQTQTQPPQSLPQPQPHSRSPTAAGPAMTRP